MKKMQNETFRGDCKSKKKTFLGSIVVGGALLHSQNETRRKEKFSIWEKHSRSRHQQKSKKKNIKINICEDVLEKQKLDLARN